MKNKVGAVNAEIEGRKRLAYVSWHSGSETFNLADVEVALENNSSRTLITHELRHKGGLTVKYEPVLTFIDSGSFSLTYEQAGVWASGDSAGQRADGDIGTATYTFTSTNGYIVELVCAWRAMGSNKIAATPSCEIVDFDKSRLYESYFRAVRDRKFRTLILGQYPRCAISGESEISALDAAHIYEVRHGGADTADNGLVLRKDLHALFDAHILRLDENGIFTLQKPLELYNEMFATPRRLTAEKTKAVLANIKARNTEL